VPLYVGIGNIPARVLQHFARRSSSTRSYRSTRAA
jgi:hypothetical protein